SSKVMRDATRASRCQARRRPRFVEGFDRTRLLRASALRCDHSKEDGRNYLTLELKTLVLGVTRFEKRTQVVGQWEYPAFAVLCCLWIQPDLATLDVDLAPFERQHFGRNAPSGDVRELDDGLQRLWQVR